MRRTLSIVGVSALAAAGIAGYSAWAPASASDAVVATGGAGGVCHPDGKAFSLGGVTRMGDSTFYRCVAVEGTGRRRRRGSQASAAWRRAERSGGVTVWKRPYPRSYPQFRVRLSGWL